MSKPRTQTYRTKYDVWMPRIKTQLDVPADEREEHYAAEARSFRPSITAVTPRSPVGHRRAVYEMAQLFQREFGFDFVQYPRPDDEPGDEPTRAYLWNTDNYLPHQIVIGACCFSLAQHNGSAATWSLEWAWFHWFERRRGHLSGSWRFFRERFGDFSLGYPISDQMKAFLRRHNAESRWAVGWQAHTT